MQLKVAIVEDDMIIQMYLEQIVMQLGHLAVKSYNNPESFLKDIESHVPDLVFLDIGLGGTTSGVEVGYALQKKYNIPFVFVSGNSDDVTYQKALEVKPLKFIRKPLDEKEIEYCVNEVVKKKIAN